MRVPGAKDKKVELLRGVTESTFPYLIADILYFHLNHTEIKVMDGPGDGRRDIYSKLESGLRAITQCKYHEDSTKSAGSRELDELPIALTKFGCREGLFATTGRISPQAKREYTDQFKGFSLSFLEGDEIVDIVAAHPLLNAIWIKNNLISNIPKIIEMPFILRVGNKDINVPIDIDDFDIPTKKIKLEFHRTLFDKPLFYPYREPSIPTSEDFIAENKIICDSANISGDVQIFEIPVLKKVILRKIRHNLPKSDSPFIVRFGKPRLKNYKGEDSILLESVSPESFIIRNNHPISNEDDYIVFSMDDWVYPTRMSALYHDWAGWLNDELNCILYLRIFTENKPGLSFPGTVLMHYEMLWLKNSLFCIQKGESQSVITQMYSSVLPNAIIQIFQGLFLVAWLHPFLTEERPNMFSLGYDFENDCYEWEKDKICSEFNERLHQAKTLIKQYDSKLVSSDFALAVSLDTKTPFVNIKGKFVYETADIVHFFDQLISPTDLNGRNLLYLSSYKSILSPEQAQISIEALRNKLNLDLTLEYTHTENQDTVYLIAITRPCPSEITTNEFVNKELPIIKEYLIQLQNELKDFQRISIRKHWEEEVRLLFHEKNRT
jgi:hypothetical protein